MDKRNSYVQNLRKCCLLNSIKNENIAQYRIQQKGFDGNYFIISYRKLKLLIDNL